MSAAHFHCANELYRLLLVTQEPVPGIEPGLQQGQCCVLAITLHRHKLLYRLLLFWSQKDLNLPLQGHILLCRHQHFATTVFTTEKEEIALSRTGTAADTFVVRRIPFPHAVNRTQCGVQPLHYDL